MAPALPCAHCTKQETQMPYHVSEPQGNQLLQTHPTARHIPPSLARTVSGTSQISPTLLGNALAWLAPSLPFTAVSNALPGTPHSGSLAVSCRALHGLSSPIIPLTDCLSLPSDCEHAGGRAHRCLARDLR